MSDEAGTEHRARGDEGERAERDVRAARQAERGSWVGEDP